MKIDLSGEFDVTASTAQAYGFLTDPTRFAPLLPMFKELSDVKDDRFRIVMDVGMPQIRGRAEADVQFVERQPGERAVLRSTVRHSLGMADSNMSFSLAPHNDGSRVTWNCVSTVRGTLASLASGILAPLARKNVDAMIASVKTELGAVPAVEEPAAADQKSPGWFARLAGSKGTS